MKTVFLFLWIIWFIGCPLYKGKKIFFNEERYIYYFVSCMLAFFVCIC